MYKTYQGSVFYFAGMILDGVKIVKVCTVGRMIISLGYCSRMGI